MGGRVAARPVGGARPSSRPCPGGRSMPPRAAPDRSPRATAERGVQPPARHAEVEQAERHLIDTFSPVHSEGGDDPARCTIVGFRAVAARRVEVGKHRWYASAFRWGEPETAGQIPRMRGRAIRFEPDPAVSIALRGQQAQPETDRLGAVFGGTPTIRDAGRYAGQAVAWARGDDFLLSDGTHVRLDDGDCGRVASPLLRHAGRHTRHTAVAPAPAACRRTAAFAESRRLRPWAPVRRLQDRGGDRADGP